MLQEAAGAMEKVYRCLLSGLDGDCITRLSCLSKASDITLSLFLEYIITDKTKSLNCTVCI